MRFALVDKTIKTKSQDPFLFLPVCTVVSVIVLTFLLSLLDASC